MEEPLAFSIYLPAVPFSFFFFFSIAFNCVKHTLKAPKKPLVSLIKTSLTTSLRLVESDQRAPLKTAGFFIKSFCIHA